MGFIDFGNSNDFSTSETFHHEDRKQRDLIQEDEEEEGENDGVGVTSFPPKTLANKLRDGKDWIMTAFQWKRKTR